MAHRVITQL